MESLVLLASDYPAIPRVVFMHHPIYGYPYLNITGPAVTLIPKDGSITNNRQEFIDYCREKNVKIVKPDHEKDIALVAVVERHKGTGEIGKGFISGFGIQKGALATSMAHDSHNIVVVGVNPNDMAIAISQIHKMGGGMVVVDEKVKAYLPLPVGGIVSDKPGPEVSPMIETLKQEAAKIGCVLNEPFITLSFMSLPVIPEIKVTNKGVVDVLKHKIVSPVIE